MPQIGFTQALLLAGLPESRSRLLISRSNASASVFPWESIRRDLLAPPPEDLRGRVPRHAARSGVFR